jgi:hypothetical protein
MNKSDIMTTLTKVQNLNGIPSETKQKASDFISRIGNVSSEQFDKWTDGGSNGEYVAELKDIYTSITQYVSNQDSSETAIQVKQELAQLVEGYKVTT